jgi:hypothetical protein
VSGLTASTTLHLGQHMPCRMRLRSRPLYIKTAAHIRLVHVLTCALTALIQVGAVTVFFRRNLD